MSKPDKAVDKESRAVPVAPRFRSAYSGHVRVATPVGVSRTKQQFVEECDINTIMRRYQSTGILPGMERAAGARYIDCTGADYQEAMLLVASAKTAFAEMPAQIRDRFGNDPRRLMEFLEDDRNLEEARELGLARPEAKAATPLAVRVVESAQSDPSESLSRVEAGEHVRNAPPVAAPKGAK